MNYVEAKTPSEGRLLGSIAAVLIENSLMERLFASQKQKDFITEMFCFQEISSPSSVQVFFFFFFLSLVTFFFNLLLLPNYEFSIQYWERGTSQLAQWGICPWSRRPRFDPWVWKIPWRRKWQPTPIFLPEKHYGKRSHGVTKELGTT